MVCQEESVRKERRQHLALNEILDCTSLAKLGPSVRAVELQRVCQLSLDKGSMMIRVTIWTKT